MHMAIKVLIDLQFHKSTTLALKNACTNVPLPFLNHLFIHSFQIFL